MERVCKGAAFPRCPDGEPSHVMSAPTEGITDIYPSGKTHGIAEMHALAMAILKRHRRLINMYTLDRSFVLQWYSRHMRFYMRTVVLMGFQRRSRHGKELCGHVSISECQARHSHTSMQSK